MSPDKEIDAYKILFGMNRKEDERSLADFLRLFSEQRLTSVLIPRMTDEEIHQIVEILSAVMRNHLNEKEYHTLYLSRPKQ